MEILRHQLRDFALIVRQGRIFAPGQQIGQHILGGLNRAARVAAQVEMMLPTPASSKAE